MIYIYIYICMYIYNIYIYNIYTIYIIYIYNIYILIINLIGLALHGLIYSVLMVVCGPVKQGKKEKPMKNMMKMC